MSEFNVPHPGDEPDDKPDKKPDKKPRARKIEVTIASRDANDDSAKLRAFAVVLMEKLNLTPKYVLEDEPHNVTPNEQLEAKVNDQVAGHLDKKAANAPKPGEPPATTDKPSQPPADPKKAEEDARGRIKRSLVWLAVNGVKLAVKTALDWAKAELKKLGGGA